MDRIYYQLIDAGVEITRLSNVIAKNADYKPCIRAMTDSVIVEAVKDLYHSVKVLQDIIKRQQYVSTIDTKE